MRAKGFSEVLVQWLASSLVPVPSSASKGMTWNFDIAGDRIRISWALAYRFLAEGTPHRSCTAFAPYRSPDPSLISVTSQTHEPYWCTQTAWSCYGVSSPALKVLSSAEMFIFAESAFSGNCVGDARREMSACRWRRGGGHAQVVPGF